MVKRGTMTAVRYRDEVLRPIVRPFAGAIGPDFVLMQDNAHPLTVCVAMAYLDQEGIEVLDCPARSADLNPIEHMWDILFRHVSGRENPPQDVTRLTLTLIEEWNTLAQDII